MSKAYEESGVNIQAGYEAVERITSHVERTLAKSIRWFRWIWCNI